MKRVAALISIYSEDHVDSFERALLSILNQSLPDGYHLNIYLGIDGPISPLLESVVEKYVPRLHCISRSTTNLGLACTLNRLIALRQDEAFFFRMDSDDVSLQGRFSAQLSYFESTPEIDILGTAIWECFSNGNRRLVRFAHGPEDARRRIDRRVPVAHPTVCMRRRVLDRLGGYPNVRGNEDISMWIRCLEVGFLFDNLPEAWLEFTVSDSFWKRRSAFKAFTEFKAYTEGIWRLDGVTWRYIFPLARLMLRLCPVWLSQKIYGSRLRR